MTCFFTNDYALAISNYDKIECQNGIIINVCQILKYSVTLLPLVSSLIEFFQTQK